MKPVLVFYNDLKILNEARNLLNCATDGLKFRDGLKDIFSSVTIDKQSQKELIKYLKFWTVFD